MAIKIICDVCQEELVARGATLFGPPFRASGAGTACIEQHLCEQCYLRVQQMIASLRAQQRTLTRERAADVPADIVLIGLRKTTKTHVQKELQREGFVVEVSIFDPRKAHAEGLNIPPGALVVGVKKDPALIQLVRQQATTLGDKVAEGYFDRTIIQSELSALERLCRSRDWPMVDVSGRPFKETAAEITELYRQHELTKKAALQDSDG
jgi:hypothetical protein